MKKISELFLRRCDEYLREIQPQAIKVRYFNDNKWTKSYAVVGDYK